VTELNVATGASDTVSVPQLGAGDAPYFLARIGDRLILWGYDIYSLDPNDLHTPPVKIADGSWFFVPSANPDRIWVIWKNEKASTPYHFLFSRVREMTAGGAVTAQGPAHGDAWLDGAVSSGVVFETNDGLLVWDPLSHRVVARLPSQPPLAASFGDTVVWCQSLCEQVHFTNVGTRNDVKVDSPPGFPYFHPWGGVFSPDGSTFAAPVWSRPDPGWHGHRAVALIDVGAGKVIGLVPGSAQEAGCCELSWDPTGTRLFFAQYDRDHWTLRYWDVGSAAAVEVDFSLRDSFAMVAA
jgi:hypothetical protein